MTGRSWGAPRVSAPHSRKRIRERRAGILCGGVDAGGLPDAPAVRRAGASCRRSSGDRLPRVDAGGRPDGRGRDAACRRPASGARHQDAGPGCLAAAGGPPEGGR